MSHDALSPNQFDFVFTPARPKSMEAQADRTLMYHKLSAFHKPTQELTGGRAGFAGNILWHHKTGEIGNIGVSPHFQRRGLATSMYGRAKEIAADTRGVRPPRHSAQRTEAGEAWARSLGERLPRRQQ